MDSGFRARFKALVALVAFLCLASASNAIIHHDPEECEPPQAGCPLGSSWLGEPVCACVNDNCVPPEGGCPPGTVWWISVVFDYCGCIPVECAQICDCDEMADPNSTDPCSACLPIMPPFPSCPDCYTWNSANCTCEPNWDEPPCCEADYHEYETDTCFSPEPDCVTSSLSCFKHKVTWCQASSCCEEHCELDTSQSYSPVREYECKKSILFQVCLCAWDDLIEAEPLVHPTKCISD